MTVKELLQALADLPADFEVRIYRGGAYDDVMSIEPSFTENAVYLSDEAPEQEPS